MIRFVRIVWPPRLLALALVAVLGTGCTKPPPKASGPSVILIVLDTLAAHRLKMYGYPRALTPALDDFARTATRYENARSPAPWTLPSHASMFTGLYPIEHGATAGQVKPAFLAELRRRPLPQTGNAEHVGDTELPLALSFKTLAEALKEQGYATAAIMANAAYLRTDLNLNQGFDLFDSKHGLVDDMNVRIGAWLDKKPAQPFFLFANFMDVHGPYNLRPRPELGLRTVSGDSIPAVTSRLIAGDLGPETQRLLSEAVDAHDLSLANLDTGLGALFADLKRRGLYDDALIIVTSDHGEFFGEHGLIGHSKDVYEPVLRVPLLIKAPRQQQPAVEARPISLVHLLAVIRPLLPATFDMPVKHAWPASTLFADNFFTRLIELIRWGDRFNRIRLVVFEAPWKYIHSSDGKHELYNLSVDPGELDNLYATQPDIARRLDALRPRTAVKPDPQRVRTPAELEQLRKLGYVE